MWICPTVVKVALVPVAVAGDVGLLLLLAAPAAAAAALEHVVEELAKLGERQQRRREEEKDQELHCTCGGGGGSRGRAGPREALGWDTLPVRDHVVGWLKMRWTSVFVMVNKIS